MQNKLNEILELCVEKSLNGRFYTFYYNHYRATIIIRKFVELHESDNETYKVETHCFDTALEYMQNE